MNRVKIDMIHDLVCSWCAIGYQHLSTAATELGVELQFSYLPHQLNPDMKPDGMDIGEYFKLTHGWTEEKHDQYRQQLIATAELAGVNIDFRNRTRYFNTHLAHRLLANASAEGVARKLHEILLTAYHSYGLNISNPEVLTELANRAGLSDNAIFQALDVHRACPLYEQALARRAEFATPSVPAWVMNGTELIIGSQSRTYFKEYLQNLLNLQNERRAS